MSETQQIERIEGWQPFATAPKDRQILVWREDAGALLVQWTTPEELDPTIPDLADDVYQERYGDMEPGWYSDPDWFCLSPIERLEGSELPTHWHELPPGPTP